MNKLIETQPSAVRYLARSAMFYFGTETVQIHLIPGNSRFEIVHSPIEVWGWEFVRYQVSKAQDCIAIVERRSLEPDEIAHFEHLLNDAQFPLKYGREGSSPPAIQYGFGFENSN